MPYTLPQASQVFISNWGAFASHWGINKTMAQVHALLLITPQPMSADEIMEQLQISRGNTNMNVRELIDWGIVSRTTIVGERKEFFVAEKDIYKVLKQITKERKKRELEPMINLLKELQDVKPEKSDEYKQYKQAIDGIVKYSEQANSMLERLIKAEESWFWGSFAKLLK